MLDSLPWLKVQQHRWIAGILLAGFLVRLIIAIFLPIGFDEAYYYLYTLHPSWSYFDHPPLVALTTGFGVLLTGAVNPFTVRLGTLLLYGGSLIFLYKAAVRLFNPKIALINLGLVSLMPIFTIVYGSLTLPDTPQLFFWMATLWMASVEFFRIRPYKPSYRIAVIGLLVGLTCLGKYHGFLLGASLVGFCLTSNEHRRALFSPWIVLASLVFALTISPVLYWNSSHEWASFRFQSNRIVPNSSYNWESFILTFLVHMLYLFPSFGFPLVTVIGQNLGQQFAKSTVKEKVMEHRFILWLSVPIIVGFAIIAGYQQVLPSWPMAAYMTATVLLAERSVNWLENYPRRFWNWIVISGVIIHILFAIALSHITLGTFQKPSQMAIGGGFLTLEADNSIQLIDVSQLQKSLRGSPEVMQALDRSDFIFVNRYFPSGQLAMALHSITKKPITCFDGDLRGFAYWSRAEEWVGKNGLYIGSETFQASENLLPSKNPTSSYSPLSNYFRQILPVATIPLKRGGVVTQTWKVYEAREMVKPYPRPYGMSTNES
jgi:4-amino-4-deoxy-L-arabinose transferase-like glycosyltransferase